MSPTPVVNKGKCIGCGLCEILAPDVFKIGKDGKSRVIKSVLQLDKTIKEAIKSCPVVAISFK